MKIKNAGKKRAAPVVDYSRDLEQLAVAYRSAKDPRKSEIFKEVLGEIQGVLWEFYSEAEINLPSEEYIRECHRYLHDFMQNHKYDPAKSRTYRDFLIKMFSQVVWRNIRAAQYVLKDDNFRLINRNGTAIFAKREKTTTKDGESPIFTSIYSQINPKGGEFVDLLGEDEDLLGDIAYYDSLPPFADIISCLNAGDRDLMTQRFGYEKTRVAIGKERRMSAELVRLHEHRCLNKLREYWTALAGRSVYN
ncbi:MAG: hypothetical protein FWD15_06110 [Alphaproteobacteria bacterium]|nr:hypothetical protein [Alphaproteobacteria bacterium]